MKKVLGGNGTVNRFDRWLLDGRDPNEPVGRLAVIRLRGLVALALAVAILGIGLMLWSFQLDYKRSDLTSERERQQLIKACEGRNTQSQNSKQILARLAQAERAENQQSSKLFRDLAANTQSIELKRVLVRQAELELQRDIDVADEFQRLSDNVSPLDCQAEANKQRG